MAQSWPWTEVPPEPEPEDEDAPLVCVRCGQELLTVEAVTLFDEPVCGPCQAGAAGDPISDETAF